MDMEEFERKIRELWKLRIPELDLIESVFMQISRQYRGKMREYVEENAVPPGNVNTLMLNPVKMVFYIGRDYIAVEYLGNGFDGFSYSGGTTDLISEDAVLVQSFDYTDEDMSIQRFICKALGLRLEDYNLTAPMLCDFVDLEDFVLPTHDALLKLLDLGYNFNAEESVLGINSGFINFQKGTFHRLKNCRFHYVENGNLKTRTVRWMDFFPCEYKETEIDEESVQVKMRVLYPLFYDELWKNDLYYRPPVPKSGAFSKLPIVNRFIEIFGDDDNRETQITAFLEKEENRFILQMAFAGTDLKSQLLCEWQDGENRADLKPDFFSVKANGMAEIIEFKLPRLKGRPVTGKENRETFSAEMNAYIAQTRVYSRYFDDSANRKWFKNKYGFDVYRPRRYIVTGRRSDFSSDEWWKIKADYPDIEIYTYDDLVDTVISLLYECT